MTLYRYKGRGEGGDLQEGTVEANNAGSAAGQLIDSGITPVEVVEAPKQRSGPASIVGRFAFRPKVKLDDLILFCHQMHTLTKAGIPMIRALNGMAETTDNKTLSRALGGLVSDLEGGRSLSEALNRQTRIFPLLLCSMVQVGEESGSLDEAFIQVSRYLEREKETIQSIKQALRYPVFVLIAISVAIIVISLFVIPAFEKVFRGMGADLPWATRAILAVSDFMVNYWPHLAVLLAMVLWGGRYMLGTEAGRFLWDRFKLRIPLVGDIILRSTLARFSRAFSMGYGAGVPMLQCLRVTARAVDNKFVGSKVDEMRDRIQRGDSMTRSAASTGMFTPLVLQMLSVGEETGSVDDMLVDVAEFYEREIEYQLKTLAGSIEPILIIAIGGIVLVLALGVFLPMWDLATAAR